MSWDIREGDCRTVLAGLEAGSVQTCVTSPPYNLGASPAALEHPNSLHSFEWRGYGDDDDALAEDAYQAEQMALLTALFRVVAAGGSCWYVHKDRLWDHISISPRTWLERTPWTIRQQIVWDRAGGLQHDGWRFDPLNEWVFWLTSGKGAPNLGSLARWSSIWRVPVERVAGHPAPFPIALAERCILAGTAPGDLVLDPYCGSGQTGLAALRTGRRFLGIERQAAYVALARGRLTSAQPPLLLEVPA